MTGAGLGLRLEPGPRAPFEQIREGITAQVAAGSLLVGTRLPAPSWLFANAVSKL